MSALEDVLAGVRYRNRRFIVEKVSDTEFIFCLEPNNFGEMVALEEYCLRRGNNGGEVRGENNKKE